MGRRDEKKRERKSKWKRCATKSEKSKEENQKEKKNSKRRGFQIVSRGFPCNEAVETNQSFVLTLKSNGTDLGTISQSHRNQMDNARAYSRSLELLDQERGK